VRDAEVQELGRGARVGRGVRDDHVLGLDVPVDDATLVCVAERVGEREADAQDVPVAERAAPLQRRKRAAAHQLGDEEALAAGLAGIEHRDDPGMVESRGGERLAPAALGHRPVRRDGLHRHRPVEPHVVRREHRPEAAGAQPPAEPVAAQHEAGFALLRGVHPEALRRSPPGPCPRSRRGGWYY
jgi:hypothetical protein